MSLTYHHTLTLTVMHIHWYNTIHIGIGPLSGTPYEFDGMYFAEVMGGMSIQGHNNVSG
jgi:hypothetical protein